MFSSQDVRNYYFFFNGHLNRLSELGTELAFEQNCSCVFFEVLKDFPASGNIRIDSDLC